MSERLRCRCGLNIYENVEYICRLLDVLYFLGRYVP